MRGTLVLENWALGLVCLSGLGWAGWQARAVAPKQASM